MSILIDAELQTLDGSHVYWDMSGRMVTADGREVLPPCEGCGAGFNEPCREWCLSHVSDGDGQPIEMEA